MIVPILLLLALAYILVRPVDNCGSSDAEMRKWE